MGRNPQADGEETTKQLKTTESKPEWLAQRLGF